MLSNKTTSNVVLDGSRGLTDFALGALSRKFLEVVRRLNERTLDYTEVMHGFQQIIEGRKWVWRTIKLGTHRSVEDLVEDVRKVGTHFNVAEATFKDLIPIGGEQVVNLYAITLEALGFSGGSIRWESIRVSAYNHGLYTCPDEVALQLCLHCETLPFGEHFKIFSRKIKDANGLFAVFDLVRAHAHKGQCELGLAFDVKTYNSEDVFIFSLTQF